MSTVDAEKVDVCVFIGKEIGVYVFAVRGLTVQVFADEKPGVHAFSFKNVRIINELL